MTTPAAPHDRFAALDALRGLALLGVLLSNLQGWFRENPYARMANGVVSETWAEWAASITLWLFVEGKAFAVFSLLFGVGLAMQAERLSAAGAPVLRILARRLCVLLVIGLVHLFLIWNGDILTEYALAGMVVAVLLPLGPRSLALTGGLCLALFVSMAGWIGDFATPDIDPVAAHAAYVQGGYLDRLRFGLAELGFIAELHLFTFPRTLGLMLLGALAWKTGLVRAAAAPRAGLIALAVLALGLLLTFGGGQSPYLYEIAPLVMAAGYAGLVLSFARGALVSLAAPVGRMALTNYLGQSVALGFLFLGHGLALQGQIAAHTGLFIGLALWLAQAAFSAWWLKSHRFGPMEWLWRWGTYGRRP